MRLTFLDALGHRRTSAARRRLLHGCAIVVAALLAAHQPGLLTQGPAQAVAATGAAPSTSIDLGTQITSWLKSYGPWGSFWVVVAGILLFVLYNASNFDAIKGWLRPKSRTINPPTSASIGPGANSGVAVSGNIHGITNSGSMSISGNQSVITAGPGSRVKCIAGDKVAGDNIVGDKVAGDKVAGDKNVYVHQPPKPNPQLPKFHTPHNLPYPNTDPSRIVGRSVQHEQLRELISPEGSRVLLTGMGGVGKSELALQVARGALNQFPGGVVLLDGRQGFEAMATEVIGFVRRTFADLLPIEGSLEELLGLCWTLWPTASSPSEPVLLLLDDLPGNADGKMSEDRLCNGLPPRFRRLITRREVAAPGVISINLEVLKRHDALRLLILQAGAQGDNRINSESQAADALCQAVGDLPLALVLLGARLHKQRDLGIANLLADLQAMGAKAKALSHAHPELGARLGVVETLMISWDPLTEPAKQLSILLALMAPAVIPWDLVEACRREDQELVEGSAFGDAQAELVEAQLLQRVGDKRYLLHPLVRNFLALNAMGTEGLCEKANKQLANSVVVILKIHITKITLSLDQQAANEICHPREFAPHVQFIAQSCDSFFKDQGIDEIKLLTSYGLKSKSSFVKSSTISFLSSTCILAEFKISLKGLILSGIILKGLDLKNVNFSECSLNGSSFYGCYFDFTDFSDTDLRWAKFFGCSLVSTNFTRANLIGSSLAACDISNANFLSAKLVLPSNSTTQDFAMHLSQEEIQILDAVANEVRENVTEIYASLIANGNPPGSNTISIAQLIFVSNLLSDYDSSTINKLRKEGILRI